MPKSAKTAAKSIGLSSTKDLWTRWHNHSLCLMLALKLVCRAAGKTQQQLHHRKMVALSREIVVCLATTSDWSTDVCEKLKLDGISETFAPETLLRLLASTQWTRANEEGPQLF